MFLNLRILLVEPNCYQALDLLCSFEELCVEVIGPVASAADGLALVDAGRVSAAVIDCNLHDPDIGLLARCLRAEGIPFIVQTSDGTLRPIDDIQPAPACVRKPSRPQAVIAALLAEVQSDRTIQIPVSN
ncbi:MAG: response regulator [Sphingomonas sp.]|uniref:hypothetical protein n=1 Tax=Sphingomonas sp. TaxID=28214 RepID=UPI0017C607BA|nr:hypothetical protein [Sphingomonas sp.]MBA3668156.1 response regulator [Sphingomonas sp.]